MKNISYLSLGSNIGDRSNNIKLAINHLYENKFVKIISQSNIYESEPLYNIKQNNFYNNIVKITTKLNPFALLKLCKNIETILGRVHNTRRNMPRTIDIDIITYNDKKINTDELVIPHPFAYQRKFVLLPLREIDPDFNFPDNKSINNLLNVIKDSSKIIKLNIS